MKKKNIKDYIEQNKDLVLVQTRVQRPLVQQVRIALKQDRITWRQFFKACFQRYLDERKGR